MPEELDRFAMLGKDARFNSKTGNKDAALMDPTNWFQSIRDGNTGQIRKLLTTGQDPEAKTREGATGLMIASQSGTRSVLRLLIAHDSKLNACDHQGLYPIHYAVLSGQTKIAKYLVKHGASVKVL